MVVGAEGNYQGLNSAQGTHMCGVNRVSCPGSRPRKQLNAACPCPCFLRRGTGHGKGCPERPSDPSQRRERGRSPVSPGPGPPAWLVGPPFGDSSLTGATLSPSPCHRVLSSSRRPRHLSHGHPHRRTLPHEGHVLTLQQPVSRCGVPGSAARGDGCL